MNKKTEKRKIKVLHIDCDADDRRLVTTVLNNDGIKVLEADCGVQGIHMALAEHPQVILMDMDLPDMDGYEVTLKIRGDIRGRDIPIVALAGKEDSRMVQAVGCDGLIVKPIEVSKLAHQVRAFADAGRPEVLIRERESRDDESGLLLLQGQKMSERLHQKIEELEKANKALLESEKVRSDFYRNLSHELSTPLTPAIGYLSMLMNEELGALTPLQKKALKSVDRGVNKVRGMVEDLLDVTALSTGKMSFYPRDYDFNLQARESLKMCEAKFAERDIEVYTSIPEKEFLGFGDSDKLRRAMVQLLENAIKFCQPDGNVYICSRRDANSFRFLVYDSGQGIPETELNAIFKTFYQVDGSPTRKHGGTGLGLALARKIVERFGGEIWAESPPKENINDFVWIRTMVGLWVPQDVR